MVVCRGHARVHLEVVPVAVDIVSVERRDLLSQRRRATRNLLDYLLALVVSAHELKVALDLAVARSEQVLGLIGEVADVRKSHAVRNAAFEEDRPVRVERAVHLIAWELEQRRRRRAAHSVPEVEAARHTAEECQDGRILERDEARARDGSADGCEH